MKNSYLVKQLQKFKENGLRPGEEVIAAITVHPENSFIKAYSRGAVGGGLLGALLTRRIERSVDDKAEVLPESALSGDFPDGDTNIAVTNMRIVAYKQVATKNEPQGIVREYGLGEVLIIDVVPFKLTKKVKLQFKDGGKKNFDVHWTMI